MGDAPAWRAEGLLVENCNCALLCRAQLIESTPDFRLAGWNVLGLVRPPEARDRYVGLLRAAGVPV